MMTGLLVRFVRDESGRGLAEMMLGHRHCAADYPHRQQIGTRLAAVFEKLARALH